MCDLVGRLKRKKYTREDWHEPYGNIEIPCDADDYNAQAYPVNPDGIEAAARITELEAENARAKALLRMIHQVGYFRREIDAFTGVACAVLAGPEDSQKATPHD